MKATMEEIELVFTEWEKRCQADPDSFEDENGTPEEYGAACAPYFAELCKEIQGAARAQPPRSAPKT